ELVQDGLQRIEGPIRVSKRKLQGHDDQQRERDTKEQDGERQPGRQERAVVLKEFDERPCQDTPKGLKDRRVLSRHGPLRMAQERRTVNLSACTTRRGIQYPRLFD